MPVAPSILPALDTIRSIRGRLGLDPFTVTLRVRTWTGGGPGLGTSSDVDTPLVHTAADGTTWPVQVTQVRRQDTAASGSRYANIDFKVGPITPQYLNSLGIPIGGSPDSVIDPPVATSAQEIFWILSGQGIAANSVFKKISEEATALHYYLVLRSTGEQL